MMGNDNGMLIRVNAMLMIVVQLLTKPSKKTRTAKLIQEGGP